MQKPSLYEELYAMVARIPYGEVASYSQIARAVGMPRGAQVTGWALGALRPDRLQQVPWWRVINAKRWLTIVNPKVGAHEQKMLLEKEGRTVTEQRGVFVVDGDDWWDAPQVPPRGR